jgi:preprotein translocase SecE subunit
MREMKHVTWPTRRDAARMTFVVISICVAATLFLFLVGWAAEALGALLWGGA